MDLSSPAHCFQSIASLLAAGRTTPGLRTVFSIGRRVRNASLDYFGTLNGSSPFQLRYSDMKLLFAALRIQVDTRGKFIIQQSELLSGVKQRKTGLLEIVEESAGTTSLVKQIEDCVKQHAALGAQRQSVEARLGEIDAFQKENEEERVVADRLEKEEEKKKSMAAELESLTEVREELKCLLNEMELAEMKKELKVKEEEWARKKKEEETVEKTAESWTKKKKELETMCEGLEKEGMEVKAKKQELKRFQFQLIEVLDKQKEVREECQQKDKEWSEAKEKLEEAKEALGERSEEEIRAQMKAEMNRRRVRQQRQQRKQLDEELGRNREMLTALEKQIKEYEVEEKRMEALASSLDSWYVMRMGMSL